MMTDRYLPIPYVDKGADFDGVNCWGLVKLVYEVERGIRLPDYAEVDEKSGPDVEREINAHRGEWQEASMASLIDFDLLILRVRNLPWHIGVYVGDGHFMHAHPVTGVTAPRLTNVHWRNRILGAYRWKA